MGVEWDELTGYRPLVHLVCVDRSVYDAHTERVTAFVDALGRSRAYRNKTTKPSSPRFSEDGHRRVGG